MSDHQFTNKPERFLCLPELEAHEIVKIRYSIRDTSNDFKMLHVLKLKFQHEVKSHRDEKMTQIWSCSQ